MLETFNDYMELTVAGKVVATLSGASTTPRTTPGRGPCPGGPTDYSFATRQQIIDHQ
jgi:hypothetical protein